MTNLVHMQIGENLGDLLLDIAQDHLINGEIDKVISTYTDSLCGFTKEYALMVLKGQAVLVVDKEKQLINLVDDEDAIEANKEKLYDWAFFVQKKVSELKEAYKVLKKIENVFERWCPYDINGYSLRDFVLDKYDEESAALVGIHNIAAKLIAGQGFESKYSSGQSIWHSVEDRVQFGTADKVDNALFYTVQYVNDIRTLYKDFKLFSTVYGFLRDNNMVMRWPLIEDLAQHICSVLSSFGENKNGYDNPICDDSLFNFRKELLEWLSTSFFGKEYIENGILVKNIEDGYDAGWLSPEGDFYGAFGATSSMIHLSIAEDLFKKKYQEQMLKDGVSLMGSENPDNWLEKQGWIKIHHNEIYGYFSGCFDEDRTLVYKPMPTEVQIDAICRYADMYCNHKFVTHPSIVRQMEPVTTYKVRQMDKVKLAELFAMD